MIYQCKLIYQNTQSGSVTMDRRLTHSRPIALVKDAFTATTFFTNRRKIHNETAKIYYVEISATVILFFSSS